MSGLLVSVCKLVRLSGNAVGGPLDGEWVVYGWCVIGCHRQANCVHLLECQVPQRTRDRILWTWRRHRIPVKLLTWILRRVCCEINLEKGDICWIRFYFFHLMAVLTIMVGNGHQLPAKGCYIMQVAASFPLLTSQKKTIVIYRVAGRFCNPPATVAGSSFKFISNPVTILL